ncbi:hypothetical protein M2366_001472 [Aeromonas sp. BIGb0405]|uniref:glycosyltransferase family A protein n=1 Tax=Aeromonas sp. BIGb0405 TaxID=2940592 RepID=UPI002168A79D|nr:glycosyltransferase family A protein [Aeromonas sp. BIGb0405]MCS3455405.1 hypothetical protein [Aeromonas sp. BIGb0405]
MEKIVIIINSFILSVYYFCVNLFSRRKITFNKDGEYIISLTTYNKRLKYVFLTIESLINQKYKASRIILWLSDEDLPDRKLPSTLKRLQSRGIEINFNHENLRSYKKLTHFCQNRKNYKFNYVVTADDDVFYPTYWLQKFKESNDSVLGYVYCYRGKSIKFNSDGESTDYREWITDVDICNENDSLLMPTGVSGICYPKDSLSDDMFDINNILANCEYADDVWYKFCTMKKGFGCKLVMNINIHFIPVLFSLGKGLETNNVQNGMNTIQFNKAMSHFNMTSKDFIKNTIQ